MIVKKEKKNTKIPFREELITVGSLLRFAPVCLLG
jgi:hypothetical protein